MEVYEGGNFLKVRYAGLPETSVTDKENGFVCDVEINYPFQVDKTDLLIAELLASSPDLLEVVQLWEDFWDKMPKGQLGKISCDIGILNEAFIKSRKVLERIRKRLPKNPKKG